jgi:ribosomal protein L12E/L44/L45/RPP1/RPP2
LLLLTAGDVHVIEEEILQFYRVGAAAAGAAAAAAGAEQQEEGQAGEQ